MGRVIHFEITADDLERAKEFYAGLGWVIKDSGMPGSGYWLAVTGKDKPGIDGALMPRSYNQQATIITMEVDDLDAMIEKVKATGGKVMGQKQPIPGVGDFVYCMDTEGNTFGMLQAFAEGK